MALLWKVAVLLAVGFLHGWQVVFCYSRAAVENHDVVGHHMMHPMVISLVVGQDTGGSYLTVIDVIITGQS